MRCALAGSGVDDCLDQHRDCLHDFRVLGGMAIVDFEAEFATDCVPGSGVPELFQMELVEPILGTELDKMSSLRRFFVEAYTVASAELKRKTEPRQEDVVDKLPPAETESRRKALAERLGGLTLEGELDPSHRWLDLAHALFEENVVRFLDWSMLREDLPDPPELC